MRTLHHWGLNRLPLDSESDALQLANRIHLVYNYYNSRRCGYNVQSEISY